MFLFVGLGDPRCGWMDETCDPFWGIDCAVLPGGFAGTPVRCYKCEFRQCEFLFRRLVIFFGKRRGLKSGPETGSKFWWNFGSKTTFHNWFKRASKNRVSKPERFRMFVRHRFQTPKWRDQCGTVSKVLHMPPKMAPENRRKAAVRNTGFLAIFWRGINSVLWGAFFGRLYCTGNSVFF